MPEVPSVAPPPLPKSQPWFGKRHSTILKLLGVGALVLVLLIPLAMITGVLRERLERRNEAVADITSSWGREQNVIGPVLGIPYQYTPLLHTMSMWADIGSRAHYQSL